MKRKKLVHSILAAIGFLCVLWVLGIAKGIDNGEPLTNLWYMLPVIPVGLVIRFIYNLSPDNGESDLDLDD